MNTVLACIDFADETDRILAETSRLAKALAAQVHLLHVIPPATDLVMLGPGGDMSAVSPPDPVAQLEKLRTLAIQLSQAGLDVQTKVVKGDVVRVILDEAKAISPERIVLGSHSHGRLYKLIVGSVSDAVLQKTKVPVLVVPSLDK